MIKVSLVEKDRNLVSLEIKGHANSAPKGQDLVCAAVSACAIGALNALEGSDDYQIEVEEGYIHVDFASKVSEHDQIVVETLIMQLQTIDVSYPKTIDVSKKERK